jgi:mono/diheme cytochrome c family protein
MKPNRIVLLTAALAVLLSACAKEEPPVAAGTDAAVAVHAAEAASRTLEDRLTTGEKLYATHCAACHQANGQGLAGAFPPLAESSYLAEGGAAGAVAAVLNGLSGPITVNGKDYNAVMPNLSYLSDSEPGCAERGR